MKHLKMHVLCGAVAVSLMIFAGLDSASATTLEVNGVTLNKAVSLTMTLSSGSSMTWKDEFGTTTETCTSSELSWATVGPFTGASIVGPLSKFTIGTCTHTTKVIANGNLSITWTAGTNAMLSSSGAEWTVQSTFFGASAICKTGTGTSLGTLTGVKEGHATIHLNAQVNCGILGTVSWTGSYTITNPTGLGVVS